MRFGSVCSGIEAATVAWAPLGWEASFFSEIEAFPSAVLAHRHPNVPNRGDMTKFKDWPDDAIDLLVGGTPCQSFSVAGLRAGLADPRGSLMLTYLAIAAKYRPRWLVWENVPGVLSSNEGRDFGSFLGGLGELGYGFAYRVLDAQFCRALGYTFAVPQRRRRVFVIGYLGDWRRAAAVLFDAASLRGDPAPRRQAGQGLAIDVAPSLVSSGRGVARTGETRGQDPLVAEVAPTLNAHFGDKLGLENQHIDQGGGCSSPPPVSMALNAGGMGRIDAESETLLPVTGGVFDVAHTLRAEGFDASEDGTGRGTPLVPEPLSFPWQVGGTLGLSGTLVKNQTMAIAFDTTQITSKANRSNPQPGDPSHPLAAGAHAPAIATRWAPRRLTPTECERLQGFPDGWTDIPYRGKRAADGPRYKALGNSMAVNVMRVIGERIALVDAMNEARAAA